MRIYYFLILIAVFSIITTASAQDTTSRHFKVFKNADADNRLRNFLATQKTMIEIKIITLLMERKNQRAPEPTDSIAALKKRLLEDSSKYYNGKRISFDHSTWIFLKNSYSWNLNDRLPEVPKLRPLKLKLKRRERLTKEDRELITYLEFCSPSRIKPIKHYIDKYIYHQDIYLDDIKTYQILYEVRYNDEGRFEITDEQLIKL